MSVQWSVPVWMWPLLLVVAAGAVVWTVAVYRRTEPAPGTRLRRLLTGLRASAFVLLALAVAGPVASCLRPRVQPSELVVVLEDSASMALVDVPAEAPLPSRWQQALTTAAELDSLFAVRQPQVRRVFLRGNGLEPLREFALDDPVIPPPTRHGTSFAVLARRLRERLAGRPVRAVVLLSDGAETELGDPQGSLANAVASLPLRVGGVGTVDGPPDRAVSDVRHPPVAYLGDEVVVDLTVTQSELGQGAPTALVVSLSDDDGIVAADTLDAGATVALAQLHLRPRRVGLYALRVEVSPLVAERYLQNNRMSLAIDVRRDRARVLVLAATPGWDVRFLAQAAARERRLAVTVAYPAAAGLVLADSLRPWLPPTTAAGWRRWEAVVLTGWQGVAGRLDWASLGEAVDGGLGLFVLPPVLARGEAAAGREGPPPGLAALLPVTVSPWLWETGDRFAVIGAQEAAHPVLEGLADAAAGATLGALPPWRATVHAQARPDARVLLQAAPAGAAVGLPALVVADRGRGRVAWLGVRQVWEWAFWELPRTATVVTDQPARHLLRSLLVWLAGGAGQAGLDFVVRPGVYQEGQPIRLGARWLDLRGEPVTDRLPELRLQPWGAGADTTALRTFALTPLPGEPGRSEVTLPPLGPGRYRTRLVATTEPAAAGPYAELVVTDTSVEQSQVRQDRHRLEQLAARAGGPCFDLSTPAGGAALADDLLALDWRGIEDRQRNRLDLWAGWPFLGAVMVLLGTEWFLRRRHGLL